MNNAFSTPLTDSLPPSSVTRSARSFAVPAEPTQQILWQLPDVPRFQVTRGGPKRDREVEASMLAALGALGLLMAILVHWPHSARPVSLPAVSFTVPNAAGVMSGSVPSASVIMIPSASAGTPGRSNAPFASPSGLRALRRPVPGYAALPAAFMPRAYAPVNVLPAAPTAIGTPIVRYSY